MTPPCITLLKLLLIALAACGHNQASNAAPIEPFPLPPESPTVLGALLAHDTELGLTSDQRTALADLDRQLRQEIAPLEADLDDLQPPPPPRRGPPPGADGPPRGRGGGPGGGMGGGGMGGPPSGGMGGAPGGGMGGGGMGPPGGSGKRGGPGGGKGRGGPSDRAGRPDQPPPDFAEARARREDLRGSIARSQHAAFDRALELVPETTRDQARAIAEDYWANVDARERGDLPGHPGADPTPPP